MQPLLLKPAGLKRGWSVRFVSGGGFYKLVGFCFTLSVHEGVNSNVLLSDLAYVVGAPGSQQRGESAGVFHIEVFFPINDMSILDYPWVLVFHLGLCTSLL